MTPNPYHKQAVLIWFTFYKFHTGQTYLMDGKQGASLKSLLKKVEAKVVERGMEPNEENIINSLKGFLNLVKDPWVIENLDISIVNSKFNVLYKNASKNSLGASRLDDLIEKRYGSKTAG